MKKILAIALLLAVAGGAAFAQDFRSFVTPAARIGSPTGEASAGHWTEGWNNMMSPQWHNRAFQNWRGFATLGFNDDSNRFAMGYAALIGDLYIAAYVGGSGFGGFRTSSFGRGYFTRPGGTSDEQVRIYDFPNFTLSNNNRAEITVGVAGMGFRLAYASTASSFSASDAMVDIGPLGITGMTGDVWVDSVSAAYGVRALELEWAMNTNLLDIGLRPAVAVRLNFARNHASANPLNDGFPGITAADGVAIGEIQAWSHNYFQPEIELLSGWMNFNLNNNWVFRTDLQYILALRTFSNDVFDFAHFGATGNVRHVSVSGTGASGFGGADDLYERSWMQHTIRPRFQIRWTGETVALGAGLVLNNIINVQQQNARALYNGAISAAYGEDSSVFTYQFQPFFELGARWFAIPDRLTVFAGSVINLGNVTRTTETTTDLDAAGNEVANSTASWTTVSTALAFADLRFGLSFHFNQHFALEAITGVNPRTTGHVVPPGSPPGTPSTANNQINVFGTGANLFTFGRIAAVLTF